MKRVEEDWSSLWLVVNAVAGVALAGAFVLFETGDLGWTSLVLSILGVVAAVEGLARVEGLETAALRHRTGGFLLEWTPGFALALIELTRSASVAFR